MHIQTRMDKRVILRQKQHIGWYADFNLQFHIIFDFSVDDNDNLAMRSNEIHLA